MKHYCASYVLSRHILLIIQSFSCKNPIKMITLLVKEINKKIIQLQQIGHDYVAKYWIIISHDTKLATFHNRQDNVSFDVSFCRLYLQFYLVIIHWDQHRLRTVLTLWNWNELIIKERKLGNDHLLIKKELKSIVPANSGLWIHINLQTLNKAFLFKTEYQLIDGELFWIPPHAYGHMVAGGYCAEQ